jgi:RND family efflux transporter MFP subunit
MQSNAELTNLSKHGTFRLILAGVCMGLMTFTAGGQQPKKGEGGGMPMAQVRFTPAREQNLRRLLTLPGTVEARTASTVAASVAGQVVEFPGKEGLRVRKGDVLARQRTVTLELALAARRADLKEADARLKLAESNLARARELFAATVIAREQLDDRQSEFNAWQGRVESLREEIRRIEDDIELCAIRAPFNGVVVREHTEVGQWLSAGAAVVELLALDEVEVRVDVPERYFADLRAGSAATLTLESLPNLRLQGKVIAIVPRADQQARTFPVKVLVDNERNALGAGMLAQVSFPIGEAYPATLVPKDAVISQGPQKFVYRLNGDNTVELVAVETGNAAGLWLEVRGNLRPGDRVITRGNERLQPGMSVQATALNYARP